MTSSNVGLMVSGLLTSVNLHPSNVISGVAFPNNNSNQAAMICL